MVRQLGSLTILLVLGSLAGCQASQTIHDPEYAEFIQTRRAAQHITANESLIPISTSLEGAHSVEHYIQFALRHNPVIHSARKRVESAALQVPVASSLQDPTLAMTVFPQEVQTAAGEQEFIVAASQKIPWRGKLSTRARIAESTANEARANLAAAELEIVAKVKHAYFELYYLQQVIAITEAQIDPLLEIRDIANTRYQVRTTSQQDVFRAELELADVTAELIELRQRLRSQQAKLARLLHVSPESNLLAQHQLGAVEPLADLEILQATAIAARPELHAKFAQIEADRHRVDLTKLEYLPDVTLSASWIDVSSSGISPVANGQDSVLLSAAINLPIYRNRLDASARSSEATLVSTAREYDSLKDETQESVSDLFAQVMSQEELIALFRNDIIRTARQTFETSMRAYDVSQVDILQLVDNWQALLRYEVSLQRLEASQRQSLAELERVVGGLIVTARYEDIPESDEGLQ